MKMSIVFVHVIIHVTGLYILPPVSVDTIDHSCVVDIVELAVMTKNIEDPCTIFAKFCEIAMFSKSLTIELYLLVMGLSELMNMGVM